MIVALLAIGASVLLQLYASSCGVLLTDDSFNYLSAAQSFRSEQQFRSPDGTYFVAWPPLFPILLSLLTQPEKSIVIFHVIAKIIIGIFLYLMASRLIANKILQGIFIVVCVCGVHLSMISVFLWSELFFLVILFATVFLAIWVRVSHQLMVPFLIAGFLLCLQRYAGIFFVAGVFLWLITDTGMVWRRRVVLSSLFFLISACGLTAWVLYVHSVSDEFSFQAYRFFEDPTYNLQLILSRIGELFVSGPDWLLMMAAIIILFASLLSLRDRIGSVPEIRLVVLLVAIYIGGIAFLGRLDRHELDRLISTCVPFIYLLFFLALDRILQKSTAALIRAGLIVVILWTCYPLLRTWQNIELWHHRSCFGVLDK